jgi:hypothetical protein
MLNSQSAKDGSMSYTRQGLWAFGIGLALAPFTGGASLLYGGVHLAFGAAYDELGVAKKLQEQEEHNHPTP